MRAVMRYRDESDESGGESRGKSGDETRAVVRTMPWSELWLQRKLTNRRGCSSDGRRSDLSDRLTAGGQVHLNHLWGVAAVMIAGVMGSTSLRL